MKARFYDPAVGRFLQPDSIVPEPGNPQSLNRYSYVYNNPLTYSDPSGHAGVTGGLGSCRLECPGRSRDDGPPSPGPVPEAPPVATPCPEQWCPPSSGGWGIIAAVLQALPITGDILDACMYLSGRDCLSWQRVPEWQWRYAAPVSLLFAVGFARYSDETLDALNAARRALSGADEAATGAAGAGAKIGPKAARQMEARGWTPEKINEAITSGQRINAVNKATGGPATRYVHPGTGQSVVVDDVTGEVIHLGGPGFKYGPESGDVQ